MMVVVMEVDDEEEVGVLVELMTLVVFPMEMKEMEVARVWLLVKRK